MPTGKVGKRRRDDRGRFVDHNGNMRPPAPAVEPIELTDEQPIELTRGNGRGRLRLLSRDDIDGRSRARRQFDTIVRHLVNDCGGPQQATTIQVWLAHAFAGQALIVEHLNSLVLDGKPVNISADSQARSTLVRIAARFPNGRVPKDISSLTEQLAAQPFDQASE